MTGYRGWTETKQVVDPLTPETLRPMLHGASEYVVVDNPSLDPGRTARATRADAERWVVEVTTGTAAAALRTVAANSDAAFDILRSWAADDDWWRTAFHWDPVHEQA